MDRRRTYVDIMERVLGNEMLSETPRQRNRFSTGITLGGARLGTAVTSIEVSVLDGIADDKA